MLVRVSGRQYFGALTLCRPLLNLLNITSMRPQVPGARYIGTRTSAVRTYFFIFFHLLRKKEQEFKAVRLQVSIHLSVGCT